MYLPPYSPDYNLIELSFYLLKHVIKRFTAFLPKANTASDNYNAQFQEFLEFCI